MSENLGLSAVSGGCAEAVSDFKSWPFGLILESSSLMIKIVLLDFVSQFQYDCTKPKIFRRCVLDQNLLE